MGLSPFPRSCHGVRQRRIVGLDGRHRAGGAGRCRSDERRLARLCSHGQSERRNAAALAGVPHSRESDDDVRRDRARGQRLPRRRTSAARGVAARDGVATLLAYWRRASLTDDGVAPTAWHGTRPTACDAWIAAPGTARTALRDL